MATLVEITFFEKNENKADLAIQNAFNEIQRLERLVNTHILDQKFLQSIRPQASNL
jgi:hypothetical protein